MTGKDKSIAAATRRSVLKGGAILAAGAAAGLSGFPYLGRMAVRAQNAPLKFWQFYAPGGTVPSQVEWFAKAVAAWNDSHPQKVELEYVPNAEYINGPKLATAFASGRGRTFSSSRPAISCVITMAVSCRI
jgi:multiple sugar transport system substrate-binding protein